MPRSAIAIIIGLTVGILGVLFGLLPVGHKLEESLGLGTLFHVRGVRPPPAPVAIVTVDQASARFLKLSVKPETWPRELHARLIERLRQAKARVIVYDLYFHQAHDVSEDAPLADAMRQAGNVVLSASLQTEKVFANTQGAALSPAINIERVHPPIAPLADAAMAVAPFPLPKIPIRVSQYWTFKTSAGDIPTLPVAAFQLYALDNYDPLIQHLEAQGVARPPTVPATAEQLRTLRGAEKAICDLRNIFQASPDLATKMLEQPLPSPPSGSAQPNPLETRDHFKTLVQLYHQPESRYLDFYGPPATIPTLSFYKVLSPDPGMPTLDLAGKAVFIGLSEFLQAGQKDGFFTVFSQDDGTDISGVEIAATAFANLLEDRHVRPLSHWGHAAVLGLWGLVIGIAAFVPSPLKAVFAVLGISAAYYAGAQYLFNSGGHWLPLAIPLVFQVPIAFFGALFTRYATANRERQNIKKAFGFYLPNEMVDRLAKDISHVKSESRMVQGICLFTDAAQYTTLSERMDPEELSALMNRYYEVLFKPVKRHGGMVSDVIGDAMLAIWATARPDPALRRAACQTALDAAKAVDRFNRRHPRHHLPTRMGLHAGRMHLGSVGAGDHFEYRAVGEVVNTASRIEGLNKYLGTHIIVSRDVVADLDDFQTRTLGKFLFAGKTQPIEVFELWHAHTRRDPRRAELRHVFSRGVQAFYEQQWQEAIAEFTQALKIRENDGPSRFYVRQCQRYQVTPPDGHWEGVIRLDRK